jgi:FdhD protein
MSDPAGRIALRRWSPAGPGPPEADVVAVEEPLEIRVGGRGIAVVMRTPGHDRDLAAGFLLTEGVIRRAEDLLDLLPCREQAGGAAGNVIDAVLAPGVAVDFSRLTRHVFSSSSCGVCGKAALDGLFAATSPVGPGPSFSLEVLAELPVRLRAEQPGFGATGGLHGCALFDRAGRLEVVREDVGRHNALDKVLGQALQAGRVPLTDRGLLVSGRISFELVQKALMAGIPVVAGIGAPSSLAVDGARRGGQALVGFLRSDRANVYAGAERLGLPATP